jgi:hypothetical protein
MKLYDRRVTRIMWIWVRGGSATVVIKFELVIGPRGRDRRERMGYLVCAIFCAVAAGFFIYKSQKAVLPFFIILGLGSAWWAFRRQKPH